MLFFFPNNVNAVNSLTYVFLPLVSMCGEQTGLVLGKLCVAMSRQPAGLPCDAGGKRSPVLQLLLLQSGTDFNAVFFLEDLLQQLNIAAILIILLWNRKPFQCRPAVGAARSPAGVVFSKVSVMFGSTPFCTFNSELTQQDVSG